MNDMPDFYNVKPVTVRVGRKCCESGVYLPPGTQAVVVNGKWAGDVRSYTFHPSMYALFDEADRVNRHELNGFDDEGPPITGLREWIMDSADSELTGKWNRICPPGQEIEP